MRSEKIKLKYISLVEASKLSSYSQEYLSLRARQGKLKALKIGRNWVTTKLWVQQYLRDAEEYKIQNGVIGKLSTKYVAPPQNLPTEGFKEKVPILLPIAQTVRLAGALALVLLFTVRVYALDLPTKLENLALQLPNQVKSFGEGFDRGMQSLTLETGIAVKNFGNGFDTGLPASIAAAPSFFEDLNTSVQTLGEGFSYGLASPASVETFTQDYGKWISESYIALDEKLEQGIEHDITAITQGYQNINDAVARSIQRNIETLGNGISKAGQNTKRSFFAFRNTVGGAFSNFVGGIKDRLARQEARPQPTEEVELQEEEVADERSSTSASPSASTQIVREVIREVQVLNNEELSLLKSQVAGILTWRGDIDNLKKITDKIQSSPPGGATVNAPVYIGPTGVQVAGNVSAGSIGATTAGTQNLGVGLSATIGETNNSNSKLTVNAESTFNSQAKHNAALLVGTSTATNLTISTAGNVETKGTVKVLDSSDATKITLGTDGSITLTGALTVQGGSNISGGNSVLAGLSVTGNTVLGDEAADTISFRANTLELPNSLNIDSNTLYIDSSNNKIGIGTASPSTTLDITGTLNATGAATLGSTLAVTGATTLSSTLGVTGATTLSSTLAVTGESILSSTLSVSGASTFSSPSRITVNDATANNFTTLLTLDHSTTGTAAAGIGNRISFRTENASGVLNEAGRFDISLTDATSASEDSTIAFSGVVAGSSTEYISLASSGATFSAAGAGITFSGTGNHDITASSGTLRIGSSTVMGNILALDNTIDIGTAGTRFDKIYADEVNAATLVGTLTGGNLTAETFNINSDNTTGDGEDANLAFERGSVSPNALITWNSTQKFFDTNNPWRIVKDDSITNNFTTLLTLDHTTTGTAAAGIGNRISFRTENASGVLNEVGRFDISLTDATSASEDSTLAFTGIIAGTLTELFSLGSTATVFNDTNADIDFRVETDNNAAFMTVDAGVFSGVGNVSFGEAAPASGAFFFIGPPALTAVANTNYFPVHIGPGNGVTIPAGTTALVGSLNIDEPNITATGTVTTAFSVRISGSPSEGSTNYQIWGTGANGTANTTWRLENTTNSAVAAHSIMDIAVGGTTSTGDPQLRLTVPGGTSWYFGVDNDDSDIAKIGVGSAVGTTVLLYLDGRTSGTAAPDRLAIIGSSPTLNNNAGAGYRSLVLNADTATFTTGGVTTVTALTKYLDVGQLTLTLSSAVATIWQSATGAGAVAPIPGHASLTLTDSSAYRAINPAAATGTLTNTYGFYVEALTRGTNNYGVYINTPTGTIAEALHTEGGNVVFNENSTDSDFRIEGDGNANMFVVDAGNNTVAIGTTPADRRVFLVGGSYSGPGTGAGITSSVAQTMTDTGDFFQVNISGGSVASPASGAISNYASLYVVEPNITMNGTATLTNAATVLIASAPTEGGTGNYALWVDAGVTRLDGALEVLNSGTNQATTGAIRLPNDQGIYWRNAANTVNNSLYLSTSNQLVFNDATGDVFTIDATAITFGRGASTSNTTFKVQNTTDSGASHSIVDITVGGNTSTGDPQLRLTVPGSGTDQTDWYVGLDNNNKDRFSIGTGTTVGSNNWLLVHGVADSSNDTILQISPYSVTTGSNSTAGFTPISFNNTTLTFNDTTASPTTTLMRYIDLSGGGIALTNSSGAYVFNKATNIAISAPKEGTNVDITVASAIRILDTGTATGGAQYGLYIENLTSGTNDYGIVIEGADAQALWISSASNPTEADDGIAFGSSRDTVLYRGAANTLTTVDKVSTSFTNGGADASAQALDVLETFLASGANSANEFSAIRATVNGIGNTGWDLTATVGLRAIEAMVALNGTEVGSSVTGAAALFIPTATTAGNVLTNNYGIWIQAQNAGSNDYGIRIDAADTQTLWVSGNSDSTTAAGGIAFGASRDTVLYRQGANSLYTDDNFTANTNTAGTEIVVQARQGAGTGAGNAVLRAQVEPGPATGDPKLELVTNGITTWYVGVDNSDNDILEVGFGTAVGTTPLLKLDGRQSTKGISSITLQYPQAYILTADLDAVVTQVSIPGASVVYVGGSAVTSLFEWVKFGAPTLTDLAITVSKATTISVAAPIEGTSLTLTDSSAIRITNTTGTPTNQHGIYIEDMTAGGSDYGLTIEGADTAALWISSAVDTTDAANGIAFGLSRDTNLYRSAANQLTTSSSVAGISQPFILRNSSTATNSGIRMMAAGLADTSGNALTFNLMTLNKESQAWTSTASTQNATVTYTGIKAGTLWEALVFDGINDRVLLAVSGGTKLTIASTGDVTLASTTDTTSTTTGALQVSGGIAAAKRIFAGGVSIIVESSNGGGDVFSRAANTSNTASSNGWFEAKVGGVSAGDPHIRFTIDDVGGTGTDWYIGSDNSGSDGLYIGTGTSVGGSGWSMYFDPATTSGGTVRSHQFEGIVTSVGADNAYINTSLLESGTVSFTSSTTSSYYYMLEFQGPTLSIGDGNTASAEHAMLKINPLLVTGGGTQTYSNLSGIVVQAPRPNNSLTTVTASYGLRVNDTSAVTGTLTSQYGIFVADMTVGTTNDYGIAIAGADTQALWISSAVNTTDAANGIAFGLDRDTNLYRSAANTLKTDDTLNIGTYNNISGTGASINAERSDGGDGQIRVSTGTGYARLVTDAITVGGIARVSWQENGTERYWGDYDNNTNRWALGSTDTDGGGTDADIIRIPDGQLTVDGNSTFDANAFDYAEWMPKENPAEVFNKGDIVGIKNGKVSHNTSNAEMVMVVSTEPSFRGGNAAFDFTKEEEDAYYAGSVDISFIGQVPAKIIGSASVGDLVLPSGNNDGTGIAISRSTATTSQFASAVGTILSEFFIPENARSGLKPVYEQMMAEADASSYDLYTVAVGVKSLPIQFALDSQLTVDVLGNTTTISGITKIDTSALGAGNNNALCHLGEGAAGEIVGDCPGTPADVAEYYETNEIIQPGDVVSLVDATNLQVKQAIAGDEKLLVGVVSTLPNLAIGELKDALYPKPVALVGRVPVRVSTANGAIEPGDSLALSDVPGVAVRSTKAGIVIGRAMEAFDGTTRRSQKTEELIEYMEEGKNVSERQIDETRQKLQKAIDALNRDFSSDQGLILMYVSIGWQGNDLSVTQTSDGQIANMDPEQLRTGLAQLGLAVNINGQLEVDILTATTKVTTPKLEVQRLQLTDQRTGDIYCTWVDNGQLTTVRGECDTIEIAGNANYGTDTSSTSSTTDTTTTQSTSDVTFTTDTSVTTTITDETSSSSTDTASPSEDGVTSTTSSSEDGTVAVSP